MKRGITLYMHVHQPLRVREYSVFDTALSHDYFSASDDSDQNNQKVFLKVADKSYRPMNALLLRLLKAHPEFKISLSITGTFIEQAERFAPDVLDDFRALVATGQVDIVAETYYHSLAFFYSRSEFERQVAMHKDKIREVFGVETNVFRNTELAYNDDLAAWADGAGFEGILAEGWDPILGWRSPNYVYSPVDTKRIKLLLKNYRLSDDLAFRFGNKAWEGYPLKTSTYAHWIDEVQKDGAPLVNLFMDYETFGEHQWEDTGIFTFFEHFVGEWLSSNDRTFYTATEAVRTFDAVDEVTMPQTVTWADTERDLTAWLGNALQRESMRHIYALEDDVLRTDDMKLISDWRNLLTSDHPYYMCTKWFNDGDVHAYFSPYNSPYDAFLYYMNAVRDMRYRVMHYHGHKGGIDG